MSAPLLIVDGLTVRAGERVLVDDVGFAVERGRTLAVIGESGSGKSMTALAVLGLLPQGVAADPDARVRLDGTTIPIADGRAMRRVRGRRIAIVFQDPMSCLNPFMRIGAQIAEVLPRGADRAGRIAGLLREVELPEAAAARYPHELSGGQQQRMMLAMALAGEPDLLIADEPTSALDASIQAEIVALLAALQARRGMALLLITHDLAVAGALAHRIAVMRHGRIVETGPAAAILGAPDHPYTMQLVEARRRLLAGAGAKAGAGDRPACAAVPAIEAVGVSVEYRSRRLFAEPFRAVQDVSLTLDAGQTLGVLGESGSGKSTLAAALAGLKPLAAGRVHLLGETLGPRAMPLRPELRRACQFVFQNPYGALNPRLTIGRSLGEPLALSGVAAAARRPRIEAALADVGLDPGHAARYPHQLSGGQRQRACIARALLCAPRILICDEAVSALDMTVQVQILELLRRLQDRHGFAMLFIGHDMDVVRWISDEILVMHAGRVVDRCRSARLDAEARDPQTRRLIAARLEPCAA